jgi:hypothetical protein
MTDDRSRRGMTLVTPSTTFLSQNKNRRSESSVNQWTTPCAYQEDTGKKYQGQALMDGGTTPLEPDEDGPAIMVTATPAASGTCEAPSK